MLVMRLLIFFLKINFFERIIFSVRRLDPDQARLLGPNRNAKVISRRHLQVNTNIVTI